MRYSLAATALLIAGLPLVLAAPQAPVAPAPAPDAVKMSEAGAVPNPQPVAPVAPVPVAPGPVVLNGADVPPLVDSIKLTQMQEAGEPNSNSTGRLTSIIEGNLVAISPSSRLQGSTGLAWNNQSVNGSWSFDTRASGSFSGGWHTDGKTYEHAGGVAINNGTITVDSKVIVHTNGTIEVTLDAAYLLTCETTKENPAIIGTGSPSKTVCRGYAPGGMPSRRAEALLPRATPMSQL